jgi:hypothetical protein
MVFGRQDQRAESRLTRHPRPTHRIQLARSEDRWVFFARPPLTARERVHAEMQEQRQLAALPLELPCGRDRQDGTCRQQSRFLRQRVRESQCRRAQRQSERAPPAGSLACQAAPPSTPSKAARQLLRRGLKHVP